MGKLAALQRLICFVSPAARALARIARHETLTRRTMQPLLLGQTAQQPPRHRPRRVGAELAMETYLAAMDDYVAAVTRDSEQEAVAYRETGELPVKLESALASVKGSHTEVVLVAYQQRLAHLASRGVYDGPIDLKRLGADGLWEPLRLPTV